MAKLTQKDQKSSYDLSGATTPQGGIAEKPFAGKSVIVAVDDPLSSSLTKRERVLVRRRVDLLENEFSHSRISLAAYSAGRLLEAIFERAEGAKGQSEATGGGRSDPATIRDIGIIQSLDNAKIINDLLGQIYRSLGKIDSFVVRMVLREKHSFQSISEHFQTFNRRGTAYYAERFRQSLETIAEEHGNGKINIG